MDNKETIKELNEQVKELELQVSNLENVVVRKRAALRVAQMECNKLRYDHRAVENLVHAYIAAKQLIRVLLMPRPLPNKIKRTLDAFNKWKPLVEDVHFYKDVVMRMYPSLLPQTREGLEVGVKEGGDVK